MARYNPIQQSFVSGEFTDRLASRDDLNQFFQSLRKARNMIALPHGALTRRSGSIFTVPVKDEARRTCLLPFQFSVEQAYVVEAGNLYMRFHANQGLLLQETLQVGDRRTIERASLSTISQGGFAPPQGTGTGPFTQQTLADYAPDGSGSNRAIVVVVNFEQLDATNAVISSVTHNGRAFTQAVGVSAIVGADQNRTEIWYLMDPDVNGDVVVDWSTSVIAGGVTVLTLKNIDTTVPPIVNSANDSDVTSLNTSVTTVVEKSFIVTGCSAGVRAGGATLTPTGTDHAEIAEVDPGDESMIHGAGEVPSVDPPALATVGYSSNVTQNRMAVTAAAFTPIAVTGGEVTGDPVEVVSPFTEAECSDIHIAQSADVMWLTHKSHWPYKLTRLTQTSFQLERVEFTEGYGPMLPPNSDSASTMALTGTTLTSAGTNAFQFVAPRDVGRFVIVNDTAGTDTNPERLRIISVTNANNVEVQVAPGSTKSLTNRAATQFWSIGAISDTVGFNTVIFHEGRLIYGGGFEEDRLFASVSDSFDEFDVGQGTDEPNNDRAFPRRCVSNTVNAVRWFSSTASELFIGTSGGEFRLRPANDDFLTPVSASVKALTNRGSELVQPAIIDNNILFVQRGGQKVRNMSFSLASDTFKAGDVTLLSEHLLNRGKRAQRLSYQQSPESVVWCVREDGALLGLTFEDEQTVLGWHVHILGGTDAKIESIAVIPTPDLTEDQLWMVVSRTVNGQARRWVEYVDIQYRPDVDFESTEEELREAAKDAYFLDAGLRGTFTTPTSVIAGLTHLIGEEVGILADGALHPTRVVDQNGEIELDYEVTTVAVGLKYRSWAWTQRFTGGGRLGTDQGQKHRIARVVCRVLATVGILIGTGKNASTETRRFPFTKATQLMDNAIPLFFGDIDVPVNSGWTDDPGVYVEQDEPLPLTILSIMPRAEVNEG